ncbi:hypothetical protein B296_00051278 [Ensete ventricosum]|uniref:Uncharacterized protein n=1 Tax=Ensete ventricosum TaxID=4639 RepID=A0A426YH86_ENSVE|nr:hypothetical protein B296_00051278 [Ensete ventricosum]
MHCAYRSVPGTIPYRDKLGTPVWIDMANLGEGTMMEPGRETAMPNLATSLQPRTIPPAQNMKIPPGRVDAMQRQPTTRHPHHYLMPNTSPFAAKHPKIHSDILFPCRELRFVER